MSVAAGTATPSAPPWMGRLLSHGFAAVLLVIYPLIVPDFWAFQIGAHADDPLAMYLEDVFTLPANLAGVPGISFNVGFDRDHLPIGMQLIGPHFREDLLLRTAHAYQQVTAWHKEVPQL